MHRLCILALPYRHAVVPLLSFTRRYWFYNTAQKFVEGLWYSTLGIGECGAPGAQSCDWRLVQTVKRVSKTCQENNVYAAVEKVGAPCFARCSQPLKRATACYTFCFYDTVLGPASNTTAYPAAVPSVRYRPIRPIGDGFLCPLTYMGCPVEPARTSHHLPGTHN